MTIMRDRPRISSAPGPVHLLRHTSERILGSIGALAAALGAWMYYGPSDGILNVFAWSWNVSEISDAWAFGALVGGFGLLTAAFSLFATKAHESDGRASLRVTAAIGLTVLALAGAITYLLIWIL